MLCQFLLYNEVSHLYIYLYPLLPGSSSHPYSPQYHLTRSSRSSEFSFLCYTVGSHQLSILHMVVYKMSILNSKFIPPFPSLPMSICLFSMSASLSLPKKQVHLYHFSRFQTHVPVFIAVLFTIARTWKQLKCPITGEWIQRYFIHIYVQWNITQP